jgi:hypothetical protein
VLAVPVEVDHQRRLCLGERVAGVLPVRRQTDGIGGGELDLPVVHDVANDLPHSLLLGARRGGDDGQEEVVAAISVEVDGQRPRHVVVDLQPLDDGVVQAAAPHHARLPVGAVPADRVDVTVCPADDVQARLVELVEDRVRAGIVRVQAAQEVVERVVAEVERQIVVVVVRVRGPCSEAVDALLPVLLVVIDHDSVPGPADDWERRLANLGTVIRGDGGGEGAVASVAVVDPARLDGVAVALVVVALVRFLAGDQVGEPISVDVGTQRLRDLRPVDGRAGLGREYAVHEVPVDHDGRGRLGHHRHVGAAVVVDVQRDQRQLRIGHALRGR